MMLRRGCNLTRIKPARNESAAECMKPARTPWTVHAYFAGEKDLAEAMVLSLQEMYRVGAASPRNVVAQFNPVDSARQRFKISDRGISGSVTTPITNLNGDSALVVSVR